MAPNYFQCLELISNSFNSPVKLGLGNSRCKSGSPAKGSNTPFKLCYNSLLMKKEATISNNLGLCGIQLSNQSQQPNTVNNAMIQSVFNDTPVRAEEVI